MHYFMADEDPTDEQIAEYERQQMRSEDAGNRMRRLLAEELTPDQLETVFNIFRAITSSPSPLRLAEWYEGMIHGIQFVRDLRLNEQTTADMEAANHAEK